MNTEQERAAFEAWANTQADKWLIVGGLTWSPGTNDYASARTNAAWAAWQAGRAALQSQDREDGFSDGVLLALQMMTDAGDAGSHLHFELIKTAGLEKIVRRALQEGMWELAGLDAPMSQSAREAIDHARRIEGEGL